MNLYKFQTVNDRSINALKNFSLFFATPNKLNDPTEGMFSLLDYISSTSDIPDVSELQKIGILSMASGDDSSIEESPFMWAHYGNALQGFCLVFDYDKLTNCLDEHIEKSGHIIYQKHSMLLSSDNLISESWGVEKPPGVDFIWQNLQRIYDACFFHKPLHFENEQEFRFISKSSGLIPYEPSSLVKIIIGNKMSCADRERLVFVLSELGIKHKVAFAKAHINSFKIHITCDCLVDPI